MRSTAVPWPHPRMRVCLELLESRQLLSFDPSPAEQEMLELINRMRANPAAELDLLLNAEDAHINAALDSYDVNVPVLRQQWATLSQAAPLAWNELLYIAATQHTQRMIIADEQSHQVDGELDLGGRMDAVGYVGGAGENVFAYVHSALHAHAAFAIDWGSAMWGIQDPPGHRRNIMSITLPFREVGISILPTPGGARETGPLVVTQDFGSPGPGASFLLGTVRDELNNNGFYNTGEGLGGLTVTISGAAGVFTTTTLSAGAYQLRVPAGTYTVTLSGGSLSAPVRAENVIVGADNVKRDFVVEAGAGTVVDPPGEPPVVLPPPDTTAPTAKLAAKSVTRPGKAYSFTVTYTDGGGVTLATLGKGDVMVYRNARFKPLAQLLKRTASADGRTVAATYRIVPPGGSWDLKDNGRYRVKLMPGQVHDQSGNLMATQTLGTFTVKLAAKAKKAVKARTVAREVLPSVAESAVRPAVRPLARSLFNTANPLDPRGLDEILRST